MTHARTAEAGRRPGGRLPGAGQPVPVETAVAAEPWRGGLLGAPTVAEASLGRANNFTLLRLALALLVVISHGFSVVSGDVADEPLHRLTGHTLGSHAVNGFFVISGYLVTMSFDRRGWLDYLLARALRIAPGLLAATAFVGLVLGACMTSLDPVAYFTAPGLWRFLWETAFTYRSNTALPGVFEHNPFRFPMGTVWTLRYEVLCYAGVFLLGVAGLLRRRRVTVGLLAFLVGSLLALDAFVPDASLRDQTMLRLPLLFVAGAAFHRLGGAIRLSLPLAVLLAALTVLAHGSFAYNALLYLTTAYGVMWLALVPVRSWLPEPRDDISYGVYLYGWPLQQTLRALLPDLGPVALLVPSVAASVLAGWISWRVVERPALALKRRLMGGADAR
ncbi:acyltransferase family protein [Camelimonas abortus]|uniref:Acyltransferase family protein n=1 Tax=Camelimonas abortus TaxID=1017184 RepID=A0ABV7LH35_9HYPH